MVVRDSAGRAIGEVRSLHSAASGRIDSVLVAVGNHAASLPADNFTISGNTLVSAMSRADVRREAQQQQAQN
jgi:hypothetical protein